MPSTPELDLGIFWELHSLEVANNFINKKSQKVVTFPAITCSAISSPIKKAK